MTDNGDNLRLNRPPLFVPNFVRSLTEDSAKSATFTKVIGADLEDSTVGLTSSFKYDLDEAGIKSTQQLKIDWTKFENHTFFNSAQVKTNVAFDTIINNFPFDGTQAEYESFFQKLTGFEKYLFDEFPKYKGYAFFSGSNGSETSAGTWITVKDMEGAMYPDVSRDHTGESKLNPELDSTTIEMWLWLPSGSNTGQTILNKLSQSAGGLDGFAFVISASSDGNLAPAFYTVSSKSFGQVVSFSLAKGAWNNISLVWDRNPEVNKLFAYVNHNLTGSSPSFDTSETFWGGINLTIGSGSSFSGPSYTHTEHNTLSGAIDDLRIWHTAKSLEDRVSSERKAVFASDDLKLYFKFNEPSGSNTLLTIDHSGNSLHGKLNIAGNTLKVREVATSSVAGQDPMTYEKLELTPILFPEYPEIETIREVFLTSASYYDEQNPNLITKLIPKHYLWEGQEDSGFQTETGDIVSTLVSGSDPKSIKLGGTQLLLSLAYVWAKYFDELKLFTQGFSNLNWADYDEEDTIPDQFLQFLAKQQGITLPPLFVGSTIEQYINRENIQNTYSTNDLSLQHIQNQIWRRILINLQDILRSKGTIHSVKSFIRTVGIDPDNNFRIREFGGPTKATLNFVRDKKSEISTLANFASGGFAFSPYLSSSKVEPGYPSASGLGAAFNADGYMTSGSWTLEGTFKFPPNTLSNASQSLFRMTTTGSEGVLVPLNVVAVSGANRITLHARPGDMSFSLAPLSMYVTGVDIFDGDQWYVSCGRQRSDHPHLTSSVSASYFLRAAKQNYGDITEAYFTQSFYNEYSSSAPVWSIRNSGSNASGSYFAIGSQSINLTSQFALNSSASCPAEARTVFFEGKVGQIRFWSKYLESKEWQEHVRNFKSLGVQNPTINFNFVTNASGSWERLRFDVSTDQIVTESNSSGSLQLFDFSQNSLHLSGTSFPATKSVIEPERFYYSYVSPKFDEASTTEKVRPRSFLDYQNVLSSSYAQVAPLYRLELSEEPTDNTRFTIDFSIVDALDQDMAGIFSTLDSLDNIIGNPELMFSPDYPGLEFLRQVYFNRLTDKINLKNFFEFYKWFDTNIGVFIGQLVPRKTKYLGTNFVIESHMLERSKMEYSFADIYLGDSNRHGLKDTIILQLLSGFVTRY